MMTIERGQTWQLNEAERTDPPAEPHSVAMWADYPRFSAVVDSVQGDYVELTVTMSNDHPRSPTFGDTLAKSAERLTEQPEWMVKE